ncbi:MAG: hypothetical protein ACX98W_21600 [bacterium]
MKTERVGRASDREDRSEKPGRKGRVGVRRDGPSGLAGGLTFALTVALTVGLSLSLNVSAATAQDESPMQEITWAHPSPSRVARFVVFVSTAEGSEDSARQIDVGKPAGMPMGSGSMRFFSALVPAGFDEFLAVAAVAADGSRSGLSSWSRPSPSAPGQPLPVQN